MATTRWNLPRTFLGASQVKSHEEWLEDVVAHCENEIEVKFPIIGDAGRSISTAYGMIDPGNKPCTVYKYKPELTPGSINQGRQVAG